MNVLFVTSSTDTLGTVRRMLGHTGWSLATIGVEPTIAAIEVALAAVPTMDLAPYDAIILIGVHGMAHTTIYTVAKQIVARQYAGRLIVIAKADERLAESEARRYFRNAGIRDDQFALSLSVALKALTS